MSAVIRRLFAVHAVVSALVAADRSVAEERPPTEPVPSRCRTLTPVGTGRTTLDRAVDDASKGPRPWATAPVLTAGDISTAAALEAAAARGPVIVVGLRLEGKSLDGLDLRQVCFDGATLTGTSWRGAAIRNSAFVGGSLENATLGDARFAGTTFLDTTFDAVDAAGADLSGASILGGSFFKLDLRGANLSGVHLACSFIVGDHQCGGERGADSVDARGTILAGARFDGVRMENWRLDGARLDATFVDVREIAAFRAATVQGSVVIESGGSAGDPRTALTDEEWRTLLSAWTVPATPQDGPSFACEKASAAVEAVICSAAGGEREVRSGRRSLRELDLDLTEAYRAALAQKATSPETQRKWLVERGTCLDRPAPERVPCLASRYEQRIAALAGRVSIAEGGNLYSDYDLPVTDAYRGTQVYRRLLPVIFAGAGSSAFIRSAGGRDIAVDASASGGNGHSCSFESDRMRFDPARGWYGDLPSADAAQNGSEDRDVVRLVGRTATILTVTGSGAPSQGPSPNCGARASWGEMTRLEAPPEVIASIRAGRSEAR